MFDFGHDAQHLLNELDRPAMSTTAYDTAWVARVPALNDSCERDFPEALEWLRRHQHPDGSWGSRQKYYHDRVICTLNALIALAEYGHEPADRLMIQRGESYLHGNVPHLSSEPHETVGFELIVPTLTERARF